MSGGFQSVSFPVPGLHYQYPYPVQQPNPMVIMSSSPQVQFPVQAQSQFVQPQFVPQTSQIGQSMMLIPIHVGQQPLISSQFPQNVIPCSVPSSPCSSSGSEIISESTVNTEHLQTFSFPTGPSNQTHGGEYYLLQPVSSFQPDHNSTGQVRNLEESSASTVCSSSSSNGVATSHPQHFVPLSFPLQQPTPTYQYFCYPADPTPLQFPSIPISNFDENLENLYQNSALRKDSTWSKVKKNPQPPTPPKPMCGFCKSNREPKEVYRGHWLRNDAGMLTCPSLRKYVCPVCQATGNNAHTIKYCPVAPSSSSSNSLESESPTKEIKEQELIEQ